MKDLQFHVAYWPENDHILVEAYNHVVHIKNPINRCVYVNCILNYIIKNTVICLSL